MRHIYLSAHLDDAVLSCGGAVYRSCRSGEPVLVVTLITEGAAPQAGLSPLAQRLHALWGSHPRPFALRKAEDLAALTLLGAEALHLDYLDAIYRLTPDGLWPYVDNGTLFGDPHPADPLSGSGIVEIAERLAQLLPEGTLYAPLAVGHHVDHQIVHAVGRELLGRGFRLAFYEDYPYAEEPGATEAALAAAGAEAWRLEVIPLDADCLSAKVAAVGYYRSQLAMLFGGAEAMPSRVWAFASTRSPTGALAERIWWPTPP